MAEEQAMLVYVAIGFGVGLIGSLVAVFVTKNNGEGNVAAIAAGAMAAIVLGAIWPIAIAAVTAGAIGLGVWKLFDTFVRKGL